MVLASGMAQLVCLLAVLNSALVEHSPKVWRLFAQHGSDAHQALIDQTAFLLSKTDVCVADCPPPSCCCSLDRVLFAMSRMAKLDLTSCQIVVDPGLLVALIVSRQRLEVFFSLLDQTEFEHEDAMIESAQKVIRVD